MFTESLKVSLELSIGTTPRVSVGAGDIKHLHIQLTPWGFEAEVELWRVSREQASEDGLFSAFVGTDLALAKLSVARTFDEVEESPTVMTVKGLVHTRSVEERTVPTVQGAPVLQRRYKLAFADRAQVLWTQHFPKSLYVDATYADVVDDNVADGMSVTFDWPASQKKHQVLSLCLEAGQASFYDYVAWLVATKGGALLYDAASDAYSFVAAKAAIVTTEALQRDEVDSLVTVYPRVRRASVNVVNAFTDAATKRKVIPNTDAVTGVREDHLIRSSVSSDLDARVSLETRRAKQGEPGARIVLRGFPAAAFRPSMGVSLGEDWSSNVFQNGKTYRVLHTRIEARALDASAGDATGDPSNRYAIDYVVDVELASDPVLHAPPHTKPSWPFHVEGKVVSEVGTQQEGTYQVYKAETTSLDQYKVKVPLFADKKVVVSFEPQLATGHFYFPMVKDARVLLALDFDRASLVSFLDWRPGARLPLETQGNHLLVGKGKDDETSIRHVYEDAKPSLTILRTKTGDVQTIKVSEGTIFIETK
jgi:hypothetical protein